MVTVDTMKDLLSKIKELLAKEATIREEKRKRGELFNIFEILKLKTSEVRLHSAFIKELLDPNGSHGMGNAFLKAFLKVVANNQDPVFVLDADSVVKAETEYPIGDISNDMTEGGRLDIYLWDKEGRAIIIENKIDAPDSEKQLLRYHNYAEKEHKGSYLLFYLTKEGNPASDYSTGGFEFEYQCLSYRHNILPWLYECMKISAEYPLIRETIRQYIINLKGVLSIMDNNESNKIIDYLTSNLKNLEATKRIYELAGDIMTKIRANFINDVRELFEGRGYRFECDEGVKSASNKSWMRIYNKNYEGLCFKIGAESHTNYAGFLMCFETKDGFYVDKDRRFKFWPESGSLKEGFNDDYPFGWNYLWGEDGKSGKWWRWDDWNTLLDMANGKMLEFIKKQVEQMEKEKVFERAEKKNMSCLSKE